MPGPQIELALDLPYDPSRPKNEGGHSKSLSGRFLSALSFPSDGLVGNELKTETDIAPKFNRFPFAVNLQGIQPVERLPSKRGSRINRGL
jgi:hypothetical protein